MVKVTAQMDWNEAILKIFNAAAKCTSVDVGFPEDAQYPNGQSVGTVARFQEYGTKKIPPRPFIRTAISSDGANWGQDFIKNFRQLQDGDLLKYLYSEMGMQAVIALQESIDAVNSPPLSPVTLQFREKRGNTSNKPLIDTGKMRESLSYRVQGENWEQV